MSEVKCDLEEYWLYTASRHGRQLEVLLPHLPVDCQLCRDIRTVLVSSGWIMIPLGWRLDTLRSQMPHALTMSHGPDWVSVSGPKASRGLITT